MVAVRQTLSSMGRVDCVDVEIRRMQNEAAARLHGPAHQHLHGADLLRQPDALDLRNDLELHQQIGHVHVRRRAG